MSDRLKTRGRVRQQICLPPPPADCVNCNNQKSGLSRRRDPYSSYFTRNTLFRFIIIIIIITVRFQLLCTLRVENMIITTLFLYIVNSRELCVTYMT